VNGFVPLAVKSHYSLMYGTASVRRLCRRARKLGYQRLALTDTDNLYGLWPFLSACRREGIVPIVGAELTAVERRRRAVCLVEDELGYANLCRLITRRHTDDGFDLQDAVTGGAEGLTVLTDDADLLAAWHAAGVHTAAALPGRPLPASHRLCRTARRLEVPLTAVPDSVFLDSEDIRTHRVLRAVANNTALSRLRPEDTAPARAWLAPVSEYRRRFGACPEALDNSLRVAEKLAFAGPDFGPVLPPWRNTDAGEAATCLREAAYEGARGRYGGELPEPVVERLEHELRVIAEMGFSAYFLIVRDIVARSPRICGRGSGAASLVAYSLGITNVCPVKHNLYFGRFLNPGRRDAPDIDVDFAWDERDDVLHSVLEQHEGYAAMVSSHVCIQPRMAIREVAKVFGLTDAEIGRVGRRLPGFWRADASDPDLLSDIRDRPRSRALAFPHPWPEILALAGAVAGAPRYLSVHPGGVVITPAPIDGYVPVQRAAKGVPILQWEKEAVEEAGLVKIDLLGNRSLGVIRDALANVRENGEAFCESRWEPEDDYATQETISQGRTMGCFYIESPAMRLLQQKTGVGDFEHLVIHSSIIRPAANDYIQEYIRRLHGGPWDPIHPLLTDVLNETFGIMVYQEDVSRTAMSMAGFSDAEADALRKVLSKKDRERRLADFRRRFAAGARARNVAAETVDAVWQMMMSFSGYSFCKPHSASYARVSFQAAYLKVHHPAEFMAAVISNQGGFYNTFAYVSEARRLGLRILPPDVQRSGDRWSGRDGALRVGLMAVGGVSGRTRARIVSRRRADGVYQSPEDFFARVRPDESEARQLIRCGALDGLHPDGHRAALLWSWAQWRKRRSRAFGPGELFAGTAGASAPALPRASGLDRLRREFSVLGFLCDRHPMELYAGALSGLDRVKAAALPRLSGRRVRAAGWLITGKTVRTRHGDPMEFLTFEDETGIFETTFFPEAYRRWSPLVDRGRPYLLEGKVEQDWGATTLTVERLSPIRRMSASACRSSFAGSYAPPHFGQ